MASDGLTLPTGTPAPPPGFVLDGSGSIPPPPGFVLDTAPSAAPVKQAPAAQQLMNAPVQPNQVGAGVHIPQHAQPSPVQTGMPGPARLLGDVAGLTPTPQAQQDFGAIGHAIGNAAHEGIQIGKSILKEGPGTINDVIGTLTGQPGAAQRSFQEVARPVGAGLADFGSDILHAGGEFAREYNSESPNFVPDGHGGIKQVPNGPSPVGHALGSAGDFVSRMAQQDAGTHPDTLEKVIRGAASFAPWALTGGVGAADEMGGGVLARSGAALKQALVPGAILGADVGAQVRQQLTRNPALIAHSPGVLKREQLGATPAQAIHSEIEQRASDATAMAAAFTAGSMMLPVAHNPVVRGATSMGGMAAGQKLAANRALGRPIGKGVPRAFLEGAIPGAVMGAAEMGARPEWAPESAPEHPGVPTRVLAPPENDAEATANVMREVNPSKTAAQNLNDFANRLRRGGVPEATIQNVLDQAHGTSALDTMKALRKAANRHFSTTAGASNVNAHSGGESTAAEGQTAGVGTPEGKQAGPGQEAEHGDVAPDQQGVGQAKVEAPEPRFPKSLGNPSPRFGTRPIQFESDVDKALYIVANPAPKSASHDAFLKFAMDATGLNRERTLSLASRVRADVKRNAGNITTGTEPVKVPALAMGVARLNTTPRAAPVVQKLSEAGVNAQVKPDGRVVVTPNHPEAEQVIHIGSNDSAESPENERKIPTEAQAREGNYPKGKLLFKGETGNAQDVPINIEHPKGAIRRSLPGAEHSFSRPITQGEYGYLPGTRAPDGEPVDVFVGPRAADPSKNVYVIHQTDAKGNFDEPKVMFGYSTPKEAVQAYRSNYPQSMHKELLQMKPRLVSMTRQQFSEWIRGGDQDVPVHAMSKKPLTILRQHGPLEATFGPSADHKAIQDAVHALNERHGLQLNADTSGIGSVVRGEVPRALGPAVHRVLAKVEGHVETTHTHTGARTLLRAGRDYDGEGTAARGQAVPAAKRGPVAGNDGVPPRRQSEAPTPAWLNVPESDAPVFAEDQGRFPVQALGVYHTDHPNQTELPAETTEHVLANRREFKLRTGSAIPEGHGFPHEVRLANLYDTERDPDHILEYATRAGLDKDKPMVMRAIRAAGYDGVAVRNGEGGHAIVFSRKPIPVRAAQENPAPDVAAKVAPKPPARPVAANADELKELGKLRDAQAAGELSEAQAKRLLDLYAKERHTATIGNSGEALPDVLNRTALNEMDRAGTRGKHVAYLDADRFKAVNDLLGHAAGDELLHSIATKLKERFGVGAVHKLGGDEFVVHHDDAAELERGIDAVNGQLKDEVAAQEGHPVQGIGLSRGIGSTVEEAENRLQANKRERRLARGTVDERAEKGAPARADDHGEHQTEHPVVQVPLAKLKLSEDVPQFKSGADAKGIVEPLGGTFDERGTGPIQVWVRKNGSMEVVSGRHRYWKALETDGKTHIAAQLYYEKDGFTQAEAASLDAELNIRDGNGKVKDYVQYFQNPAFDGEAGRQAADARGLLARATGQRAYTIARQGTPELIAAHRADTVSDEAAYKIAQAAPNDARLQVLGIKLIRDGKSIAVAQNTVRAVQTLAPSQNTGDLFGLDDSAMKDAQKMAEAVAAKQRDLSEDLASVTGASKRPERARKRGVQIGNEQQLQADIERLKQERAAWDNWQTDPEKVGLLRQQLDIRSAQRPGAAAPRDDSGELFGAPTQREHLAGAERAQDAARNGLNAHGRTDMLSGEGELFAGTRPEQARILEAREHGIGDYQGMHVPPGPDTGAPLWDLTSNEVFPADVYSSKGPQYYGTGDPKLDREAHALMLRLRNDPNALVKVYRAIPADAKQGSIQQGDWVTPIRRYAEAHGEGRLQGNARIVSKDVHARDLFTNGDSGLGLEAGYFPQPETPRPQAPSTPEARIDPYAGKELRPDAAEIVTKGREAFHAFVQRYGGTVVGDAISHELVKPGTAQLLGRTIRTTDDLAALMGIYRDPTMETLHYILTDADGRAVDEIAFSSRLPASGAAWASGDETIDQIASAVAARAQQAGAKGVWLAHNHPSGNPQPSPSDTGFTKALADAIKKVPDGGDLLKGHVVIDHTTYASIAPDGTYAIHPLTEEQTDFTKSPSQPHPVLGGFVLAPHDLADVAASARKELGSQVGIVTVDSKGRVRSLTTLPEPTVTSMRGPYLIRQLARRTGAYRIFAVLPETPQSDALMKAIRNMYASSLLRDVILPTGAHIASVEPERPNFGQRTKVVRVHEEVDPYDLHRADDEHRVAPPFELTPLSPPVIRPFDRERAKEMDYSGRSQIVQFKVSHGLFRSALAQVDRQDAATATAFASAQAMFDKRDPKENLRDIARRQRGLPIDDPAVHAFFTSFKEMADRRVQMIRAFGEGYLEEVRAHYFPNLWKDPAKAEAWLLNFGHSTLEGSKSFMDRQLFPTVLDGIKAGLEPISTNPADLAMRHLHDQDHFIAMHDFRSQIMARNMVRKRAPGDRLPAGWGTVDDPAFKIAGGLHGEYIVPKDVAHFINNYLSPGFNTSGTMGTVYRSFRRLQVIQLSMKLGMSLFHAGFTTFDHLATNVDVARGYLLRNEFSKAGKAFADALLSPVTATQGLVNRGPGAKLVRQFLGTEPMDANTEAILGALVQGGARVHTSPTMELDSLHKGIRALRQSNYRNAAAQFVPATLEAVMRPIQRYLVPAQKMFARVAMMKLELDRYAKQLGETPGNYAAIVEAMHPDFLTHIAGKIVDAVDDRLGQMNTDNRAMNKYLEQVLQVTTLSPTWNIGSVNVVGGPIVDLLRALPVSGRKLGIEYGPEERVAPLKRGESVAGPQRNMPVWTGRMSYLLTMVATFGLANVLGTYLMTGKGPESAEDLFTMTGPDGTRFELPTYMRFMYEIATHPVETVENKSNPTLDAMHQLATNRSWNNTKIFETSHADGALSTLLQHTRELADWVGGQMEPIAIANQQENARKGGGIEQDIAPFFGVTRAPAYMQRSAFQNYVSSRYIQDFDGGVRTRAQVERAQRISLAVRELRAGKKPDLSNIAPVDRPLVYKYAQGDPYTAMMKRLPLQQRITAYEDATAEERKKLNLRAILYSGANYKQLQRMPPEERAWAQAKLQSISQQEH